MARAAQRLGRKHPATIIDSRVETNSILNNLMTIAIAPEMIALVDQVVVSGTSFLTMILISRWATPSELGIYAICISCLVCWLGAQDSLICLPYTIARGRVPADVCRQNAGHALALNGYMSALALVVLSVFAIAISGSGATGSLVMVTWVATAVVPVVMLREFGRKFALAHIRTAHALAIDVGVSALQLGMLGSFIWCERLSAPAALAAVGIACAFMGGAWLYLSRDQFSLRGVVTHEAIGTSWRLGKWLFASQMSLLVQNYVMYWLLAWLTGAFSAGLFAACMTIAQFSNPLTIGLGNVLIPRAVLALQHGGGPNLLRQITSDTLLIGVIMTVFCAIVLLLGDQLLILLYGGDYSGQGRAVAVLALALLASAIGMPASNALAALEHPRTIFWAGLIGAAITVVLVSTLVSAWGVIGAAYGFLAGNIVGSVGRCAAFLWVLSRRGSNAESIGEAAGAAADEVRRVLDTLPGGIRPQDWLVTHLGEGIQANVYAVRSKSQEPLWRTYSTLVIKIFKPGTATSVEVVVRQFAALSQLHTFLNGQEVRGWNVSTPEPLHVCASPLAIVMTRVPGRMLGVILQNELGITSEFLANAPKAIAGAMESYWSRRRGYGDLSLDNILCDVSGQKLAFVDPGSFDTCDVHNCGVGRAHFAAGDLAYLLYDAEARMVKSTILNANARLRKQTFAENVLRAVMGSIGAVAEKRQLLNDIKTRLSHHLTGLERSWTPYGIWCRLVGHITTRRLGAMLDRLRFELDLTGGTCREAWGAGKRDPKGQS
jgi:O-antigen/teichoic acid export membrane protein